MWRTDGSAVICLIRRAGNGCRTGLLFHRQLQRGDLRFFIDVLPVGGIFRILLAAGVVDNVQCILTRRQGIQIRRLQGDGAIGRNGVLGAVNQHSTVVNVFHGISVQIHLSGDILRFGFSIIDAGGVGSGIGIHHHTAVGTDHRDVSGCIAHPHIYVFFSLFGHRYSGRAVFQRESRPYGGIILDLLLRSKGFLRHQIFSGINAAAAIVGDYGDIDRFLKEQAKSKLAEKLLPAHRFCDKRHIRGDGIRHSGHLHRHIVGGHKGIASLLTDGCGDIAAIHRDLKAVGLGIAVFQRIAESELLTPGQLRAVGSDGITLLSVAFRQCDLHFRTF